MDFYRIACIVRAHGVQGGVKLLPLTDSTARFRGMSDAYLEKNGAYLPVALSSISIQPDAVMLHIEGVQTREAADALRGAYLCVDRANAVALPEGRYFISDLIGCKVSDTEGKEYGTLTEVLETGANDVYVIQGPVNILLPALKKVLVDINIETKHIVIDARVTEEVAVFED